MKKVLAIVFCMLAILTSCQKGSVVALPEQELSFTAGTVRKVKAVINSAAAFKDGDAFGVFGSYSAKTDLSVPTVAFDNTPVTYQQQVWNYQGTKYWMPTKYYRFRAFYPYSDPNQPTYTVQNTFGAQNSTYTISDFKVNSNVDEQQDLMVSEVVARGPIAADVVQLPVSFTFSHLLTQVNFRIKRAARPTVDSDQMALYDSYSDFTLTSVRVFGMKSAGDYDSATDTWIPVTQADETGYIRSFSGNEGLIDPASTGTVVWTRTGEGGTKIEEGLLMVPQKIEADQVYVDINFTVMHEVVTTPPEVQPPVKEKHKLKKNRIVPLPTSTWAKSKNVMYVAEINSNSEISFSVVSVEPWAYTKNSDIIMVK